MLFGDKIGDKRVTYTFFSENHDFQYVIMLKRLLKSCSDTYFWLKSFLNMKTVQKASFLKRNCHFLSLNY